MRPCSSFSWSARTFAASRLLTAWVRSLSVRLVTSSRISSFSNRASRFWSRRSSNTLIFATNCSKSRSAPSSGRQRSALPGFSSLSLSSSVTLLSFSSCSSSIFTRAFVCSISGRRRIAAMYLRLSSSACSRTSRSSSSFLMDSDSPLCNASCCWLERSYKIQSSSFRSMSCTPVTFLSSTAFSYLTFKCSISFSKLLMTTFSLSIS
mmetsp:Transcript_50388/g.87959  ORF Transcript_50388/g.87959 Transcript_50388/m.87959 type:complete len:207 (-) Transcript_50388:1749-2369(-)